MDFLSRLKNLDWILNAAILFLAAASFLSIYGNKEVFYRQLIWYCIGLTVMFLASQIDWRPFLNYRWVIFATYFFSLALLLFTYFFAPAIRGTKGWLTLGPLQFQTAEFAKLILIIVLSWFWAKAHIGVARVKNLFLSFAYFALPAGLVMIQPDLGSALILFGIWFGYLLISGIKWKHLLIALIILAIVATLGWTSFLKEYQKDRILDFLHPGRDPLGVSYSVIQSKITIGSAGILGKGFGQGTQVKLGFLPEAHTDFILASFIEEWGLLGGVLAIMAFLVLLTRIIKIGLISENNFFKLFCLGSTVMFLSHFVLNVGSSVGLFPVVGVPFPFFSYGGSQILTASFIIGIIQSIIVRSR
ncbi:MAG: FtsW/RodA/SpoVE family cell cycle protein [Candidatus Pacebacteria bacterium]|nr:FtsW/RodA/SpoVE family cell cycle protein [Candidatus Paceibacterota bacterium]